MRDKWTTIIFHTKMSKDPDKGFIKSNASVVTALPLVFLLIAVYSISNLALRENMAEFDKALSNINDIENIK